MIHTPWYSTYAVCNLFGHMAGVSDQYHLPTFCNWPLAPWGTARWGQDCSPCIDRNVTRLTSFVTQTWMDYADGCWTSYWCSWCWTRSHRTLLTTCLPFVVLQLLQIALPFLTAIEGLDSVEAFASMNGDSDSTEMAKWMATRSNAAAGRLILGTMQSKRLQASAYWVKDHDKCVLQAVPEMWTQEVKLATIKRKESDHNLDKANSDIINSSKCQTDAGWDNWQIGFVNKLHHKVLFGDF